MLFQQSQEKIEKYLAAIQKEASKRDKPATLTQKQEDVVVNDAVEHKSNGLQPSVNESSKALDRQVGGTHYKNFKIEPLEFFVANGVPYAEASIIKYILRYKTNRLQDLEKAKHVLEYLIEEEMKKV